MQSLWKFDTLPIASKQLFLDFNIKGITIYDLISQNGLVSIFITLRWCQKLTFCSRSICTFGAIFSCGWRWNVIGSYKYDSRRKNAICRIRYLILDFQLMWKLLSNNPLIRQRTSTYYSFSYIYLIYLGIFRLIFAIFMSSSYVHFQMSKELTLFVTWFLHQ